MFLTAQLRIKYIAQPERDDEKTKLKDTCQFRVLSHAPKSDLEKICDNVKDNVDLSGLKKNEFSKLGREDQNVLEE